MRRRFITKGSGHRAAAREIAARSIRAEEIVQDKFDHGAAP
jgi:hypothetical protein